MRLPATTDHGQKHLASSVDTFETADMTKPKRANNSTSEMKTRRSRRPRASAWAGATARRSASEKVDAIFKQWQAERPDIDPSPVHIFRLICELYLQTTAFINEVLQPYGLYR